MPCSHSCAPPFYGPEAGLPHTLWGFLLLKLRSKPQEEKGGRPVLERQEDKLDDAHVLFHVKFVFRGDVSPSVLTSLE